MLKEIDENVLKNKNLQPFVPLSSPWPQGLIKVHPSQKSGFGLDNIEER